MLLNVSFEKTISIEIEVDDNVDINDPTALVDAITQSDEMNYLDEWIADQPFVGCQIDDADGNILYGEPYGSLIFDRNGIC